MSNKLILTISVILPNLLLASTENNSTVLKVESATESESLIVENILSNHASVIKINKDMANNITVHLDESQEQIKVLILKLQNGLGSSVKIGKYPVALMKIGTQDF